MSHSKRPRIAAEDLEGFRYFKKITRLLERLHDTGGQRDRAGNRQLFMDQYLALLLLHLFNPICRSLRGPQQASELQKVQRLLGVGRAGLGSLAEAARVFDADLLPALVGELVQELRPLPHDIRLDQTREILTLVDGAWLTDLPRVVRWVLFQQGHRAAKAHVEFEVLKGVPVAVTITNAHFAEAAVLKTRLQAGRLHVIDRGYAEYALFPAIFAAGSSFVGHLLGPRRPARPGPYGCGYG